jgi:L-ribulose-5-phosphate 3-epimerase UlaE
VLQLRIEVGSNEGESESIGNWYALLRARVREIRKIARIAERAGEIVHEISVDESKAKFNRADVSEMPVSYHSCVVFLSSWVPIRTGNDYGLYSTDRPFPAKSPDRESHRKAGAIVTIGIRVAARSVRISSVPRILSMRVRSTPDS